VGGGYRRPAVTRPKGLGLRPSTNDGPAASGPAPAAETAPAGSSTVATQPARGPTGTATGGGQTDSAPSSASNRSFTVKPVAEIARGACGTVSIILYKDAHKKELRVMKEMPTSDKVKVNRELEQFKRQSSHPNVVKYLFAGSSSTQRSHMQIQMELMDLGSLRRVIDQFGKDWTADDRLILCRCVGYQVFMALDYFHNFHQGMHRDVKPANILLHTNGRVKLCDFDTSVSDSLIHDTGVGTQSYSAPEVIRSERYNCRCDVWAAAAVMFELAAGKHPYFDGGSMMQSLCVQRTIAESVNWGLLSAHPPELTDLLQKCLVDDPARRFTASQALQHKFFDAVARGRLRDKAAEAEMVKRGIEISTEATERMMQSWRRVVDVSSPRVTPSNSGTIAVGSNSDLAAANNSVTSPNDIGASNSTRSFSSSSGGEKAAAVGSTSPSSPVESKKEKGEISDVMKRILYNWEYEPVHKLQKWIVSKSIPTIKPEWADALLKED
jgi:serine/threonine protein kinase